MSEATLDATPAVAPDAAPQRLDPRIVTVWRIVALIPTAILVFAGAGAAVMVGWTWLWALPALFLVIGGGRALALPPRQWRAWSWRVGEADVRVERGVFWRHSTVVLHARIQHVDTHQGPIERMFGLARVLIHTAGTVGAVVEIPGLAQPTAEALRDRLAALSGAEDAV